jgi:1,4-dihydroxy-2-naphthoate polyprenyltransferase
MAARLQVWIEAARPKTLPAAIVPVLVATALAEAQGGARPGIALICLAFALLVQIGTNFANDYFDFVKGADTAERVGPRRSVAAGLIPAPVMLRATLLVLACAFLVGLLLVREGGWWLLPVGLASLLCAIAYTGGPYPLGYKGLGDIFVFLFFGLVAVVVTHVLQTRAFTAESFAAGAAIGLLAANILVANNYRDAETDARAGKRTLVVRFGRRFALWQFGLSHLVALFLAAWMALRGFGWPALLPLLLAPTAARLTHRLGVSTTPAEQIAVLAGSARYLAAYGILLSLGVMLGAARG